MSENKQPLRAVQFYETHPINEVQILETLRGKGISLDSLTEETLKDFDQDHYGGIEAVDTLAQKAGIQASHLVLDVCSGMGGPARYLAHRYGCRTMGLDITESRYRGSLRLTQLVKLDHRVDFRLGDAADMPFAEDAFDVVIGQEAWLHVPDKALLIAECARVVKTDGVIAFTDVVQRGSLGSSEWKRLQEGMAVASLETLDGYGRLLGEAGCSLIEQNDLGDCWARILAQRLEMYRSLKEETVKKFGAAHYRKWDDVYGFYVDLFAAGKLGGGRFIARRCLIEL